MLDAKHQAAVNDIAIVGMALRVPGASDLDQFWDNLKGGVESIRDLSAEELLESGEDPARSCLPNYVARTADLPDMEMFDAEFFGLSPKDAAIMDPQHRQFLECAWEALENAGKVPDALGEPVGVFAGCGMGSYFYFNVCSHRQLVDQVGMFLLRHTGNDKDFLATRASYLFNLRGPSVNIQTACSTSLVAVHYAAQSLLSGECSMALAGGVTIEFPHRRGYLHQEGEILSPDGHCRPFDHRAQGTVFGSGAGVVILRRLSDALRDGDYVHAVIKGSAINNDGSSKSGYLAPSVTGQAEAIVEAHAIADIDPRTIQYVECHGTGTYLGDPIEIEALSEAFRQGAAEAGSCFVGSVKSNIGHLDTAAGVVGLIKTALALKHGAIPPTLNFQRPNPSIDFDKTPFKVCERFLPWPSVSGPRRAAVNSLGVGGTNAHVVLEEAPVRYDGAGAEGAAASETSNEPLLLLLSARNRSAVEAGSERLKTFLQTNETVRLQDVSHTLIAGRKPFEEWAVVAARDRSQAVERLADPTKRGALQSRPAAVGGAVFMFPGGGAQYPGMGQRLYREDVLFKATVDEGLGYLDDAVVREIKAAWLEPASPEEARQTFLRPSLQLPSILILEVALARSWLARGLQPVALIGHSMGEYAAACLAGVMTFDEAVRLVRLRGELFETVEPGGMLSVSMDEEALSAILPDDLDLACVNAPSMCVVSGREPALEAFRVLLAEQEIEARHVPIRIAAHSRLLDGILTRFRDFVATLDLRAPSIPVMSNRTGRHLDAAQATDPEYWTEHLRNPVKFSTGLSALAKDPSLIYIEVGPGRVLSSLARCHDGISAEHIISSLPHADQEEDDRLYLITAVGRAFAAGLPVNIDDLVHPPGARLIALPSYAFQHRRYFIDVNRSESYSAVAARPLSKLPDMQEWGYRPAWKRSVCDYEPGMEKDTVTWLFFTDEDPLATKLVMRLRESGHSVVVVACGDKFVRKDGFNYILCPELGRQGYEQLVTALRQDNLIPSRIVHMWLAKRHPRLRPGSSKAHQDQECGFDSLVALGQVWSQDLADEAVSITIITSDAFQVEQPDQVVPERALVLGPALVMPKELTEMSIRVLDIDPVDRDPEAQARRLTFMNRTRGQDTAPMDDAVAMLWEEIHAPAGCEVVAIRSGRRWRQFTSPYPLEAKQPPQTAIRDGGVYMFVGGLSEIALALAAEMARKYKLRLVLVGRLKLPEMTQMADPDLIWFGSRVRRSARAIRQLEELGAEALYISADITDHEAMAAAVETAVERFGRVDGVFHCAGTLDDGLLSSKTTQSIERVLSSKVTGTRVLDAVLKDYALDFMVLCSSTSLDVPRAGQVDYVAANAYLDAYACHAAASGRRVLSVHWGVWKGVGLAARAVKAGGDSRGEEAEGGFFYQRRIEDEASDAVLFERTFSSDQDWLINEHRLVSGLPIMPGTGYIELLLQAVAGGEQDLPEIFDLSFIRPLAFDGEPRSLSVQLQPQGDRLAAVIGSRRADGSDEPELVHARAILSRGDRQLQPWIDLEDIRRRCLKPQEAQGEDALPSPQDNNLAFGPRWRVLRSFMLGNREALATLTLPDAFLPDLDLAILHPALMDIATGFALPLSARFRESGGLWVPARYSEIAVYGRLPATIVSWARLVDDEELGEEFICFDVTLASPDGQVLVEIRRFVMGQAKPEFEARSDVSDVAARPVLAASPSMAKLKAQVDQGIEQHEGFEALERALSSPYPQLVVTSLDLEALRDFGSAGEQGGQPSAIGFQRPELDRGFVAPTNAVEETLAGFWRQLLGLEQVGINDDFFALGGHSLIAVRLFRLIKSHFGVDLPISTLFEASTIAQCAQKLAPNIGQEVDEAVSAKVGQREGSETLHLVLMDNGPATPAKPLFICAGMFGNILNLRYLARVIGHDRPVYGLQARGLYGEQEPHTSFEEMARDYIKEIRQVQAEGPYLLAGYSGGGLTALEMAHQLLAQGEEVAHVALFDTPLPRQPKLSLGDRAIMKLQDVHRHKNGYLIKWLRDRRNTRSYRSTQLAALGSQGVTESFSDARIEHAFRAAAHAYQVKPYSGPVTLFRPKPQVFYRLSKGRCLQENRNILLSDNGWGEHIVNLTVQEVPGDHDSMVLDPSVRTLADRLRDRLRSAEAGLGVKPDRLQKPRHEVVMAERVLETLE